MVKETVLVVGAAGNVGQGIVAAVLASGRNAVAAELKDEWLVKLTARHAGAAFASVTGSIASEDAATALWNAASEPFGGIDHVVVSVNVPVEERLLMDFSEAELSSVLIGNVLTHFVAAKVFLPLLPDHGLIVGIGGGTADFIFPKMAPISMTQAATRMLYRGFGKEIKAGAQTRELMIISMVNSANSKDYAKPDWVTAEEVGQHICAILTSPDAFPKPILHLRSREQVGHPEAEA